MAYIAPLLPSQQHPRPSALLENRPRCFGQSNPCKVVCARSIKLLIFFLSYKLDFGLLGHFRLGTEQSLCVFFIGRNCILLAYPHVEIVLLGTPIIVRDCHLAPFQPCKKGREDMDKNAHACIVCFQHFCIRHPHSQLLALNLKLPIF